MWFTVSILTKALPSKLWQESIFLLQAKDKDEATAKGEEYGRQTEHSYISTTGEEVIWKFDQVNAVYEVLEKNIGEGTEIFSRFLRESEAHSLSTPFDENDFKE